MSNRIVVIGGGAAGMMAAVSAAERGGEVTLLEPNERLGKKLNITGKGRCNVTNNAPAEELLANVPRNGRFLYSAFSDFDGRDAMAFFEALGVPLKTERGKRVFPVSDRSFDVSAALEKRLKTLRVAVLRDRAVDLKIRDGVLRGVKGERRDYPAEAAILATGGVSYPATGSTGEGHVLAAKAGHTVTPLTGSLVPLEAALEGHIPCVRLQGLSLRNVGVTVYEAGKKPKKVYEDFGELLFTHFGVSGPTILSASAHLLHFDRKSYYIDIDLKPALDEAALDRRILSDFAKYANSDFDNALDDLLPRKLIPVVVELSGIPGREKVHDVTREQRQALLYALKHLRVLVTGPAPVEDAIVTRGGVKVSEVDPRTMESKLVRGLYFAGEILDVDAYTGGFSLQIAWATGRRAGRSACAAETDRKAAPGAEKSEKEGASAMKTISIAIDGPSGAGKSTLARSIAGKLGFLYVDTGAIYRTVGCFARRRGVDPKDAAAVAALLPETEVELRHGEDGLQQMFLNGEDVTKEIRLPEISLYASAVSAHPEVRAFLLEMQRQLAREYSVVMDGRDIGTVVLPEAEVKVFLTASARERARRRCLELEQRGTPEPFEKVLSELEKRDWDDAHRAVAPLRQAEDAVLLDTTALSFAESEAALLAIVKERTAQ